MSSFCNDSELKVSNPSNLSDSLLVTGFSYDRFETEDNNYAEFCYLTHKTRGVRRGGAAAVDLAFVAAGKVDGYWERGLEVWDLAAARSHTSNPLSQYPSTLPAATNARSTAAAPPLLTPLVLCVK